MSDTEISRQLEADGCTDGLPIVAPTSERVERMALASGLDPELSLGVVPPRCGSATVEAVAANAVMAGCQPDYFPIVIAAVKAVLAPEFDLDVVQTTTNAVAPCFVISGPARNECGRLNMGFGALGPGGGANLAIGRAIRLVLLNVGGGHPGSGDLAILGHGGKISCCLAENEEDSPFEPLHVARGFGSDESVVTVFGVEGPQSVLHIPLEDAHRSTDLLARLLGEGLAGRHHLASYSGNAHHLVVLNPDHADVLGRAGVGRAEFAESIGRYSTNRAGELRAANPSVMEQKRAFTGSVADDDPIPAVDPKRLAIAVAGGRGNYSFLFPSWGGGRHGTVPVSQTIDLGASCALPWASASVGGVDAPEG